MLTPLGARSGAPVPAHPEQEPELHREPARQGRLRPRPRHRAIVQAPRSLPRVDPAAATSSAPARRDFVFLSSVICTRSSTSCSPAWRCNGCYQFRVTRNSDLFVDEEEVETCARARGRAARSAATARPCGSKSPHDCSDEHRRRSCCEHFAAAATPISTRSPGPVNLNRLLAIYDLVERPDLKYPPFTPGVPKQLAERRPCSRRSAKRDILLHHPFESFAPVIDFIRQRRERSRRARDQADAVPHRRRLAARREPGRGRAARARKSPSSSSCARASTRKPTSSWRAACRKPARTSCTASSATRRTPRWRWSCAARAARLRRYVPPRHRQLPPAHRARLHRLRPAHRERGASARTSHELFHAAHEPRRRRRSCKLPVAVAVHAARAAARR